MDMTDCIIAYAFFFVILLSVLGLFVDGQWKEGFIGGYESGCRDAGGTPWIDEIGDALGVGCLDVQPPSPEKVEETEPSPYYWHGGHCLTYETECLELDCPRECCPYCEDGDMCIGQCGLVERKSEVPTLVHPDNCKEATT